MNVHRNGIWRMGRSFLVSLTAGLWLTTPLGTQTSFDWLNDAVHPRGMALVNASVAAASDRFGLKLFREVVRQEVSTCFPTGLTTAKAPLGPEASGSGGAFFTWGYSLA